jgi:hypothetical protein
LVQGAHQQPPGPFPVRVDLHERFQFADRSLAAAAAELGVHRVLEDRLPQLGESLHLTRRQRLLRHPFVRLAAKRPTSSREQPERNVPILSAQRLTRLDDQGHHPPSIDLDELRIESIAATELDDRG